MAKITVNRSWNFIGMTRAYKVFMNDKEVGRVKNNSSVTLDVEPGNYRIRVGISKLNGMSNTLPIHIEKDDDLAFTTQMSMYLILGTIAAFVGGGMVGYYSAKENTPMMIFGLVILMGSIIGAALKSIKLKQTV